MDYFILAEKAVEAYGRGFIHERPLPGGNILICVSKDARLPQSWWAPQRFLATEVEQQKKYIEYLKTLGCAYVQYSQAA